MANPNPKRIAPIYATRKTPLNRMEEAKEEAIAQCIELYESGMNLTEVSEATSIKRDTIYRWLKNRNIIRSRGESLHLSWALHKKRIKPARWATSAGD
jgi:DNA invertase Pin-like site-specific DNA recombinase